YFYIPKQLESIKESLNNEEMVQEINQMEMEMEGFHQELLSDEKTKEKVDKINDMLMSYQTVKSSDLKYQKVDTDYANEYRSALASYEEKLTNLDSTVEGEEAQNNLTQTAELFASTKNKVLESNFIWFDNYKKYFK